MGSDRRSQALGVAVSTVMCAASLSHEARAQEAEPAAGLEEIVVTAQKREERLQDVPISITAITGEQLEERGVSSVSGLNAIAPNVMFRQSPGARLISVVGIRGSVAGQPAIWLDPPVGLYLNGVYLGKSQGSVFDIAEIERVEVLRGPQGTLFGRNTEGGAINFITRQPSGEYRGKAGVEFGNFEHRVGKFSLDLPRFGIASVSLALRKEKRDGWAENLTGPDLGAVDSEVARASVKLDFSDRFDVIYDFDYSSIHNTPVPSSLIALNGWAGTFPSVFGAALGGAIQAAAAPFVTTSRPDTVSTNGPVPFISEEGKTNSHAVTATYEVSDNDTLKYIASRRSMRFGDRQDIDGMPLDFIATGFPAPFPPAWGMSAYYNRITEYEQDTHELQWIGDRGGFNFVLGAYYFTDDGETNGAQLFTLFGNTPQRSDYASSTDAWAVFGQANYAFTDRWTATVGVRYTEEEKSGWTHRFSTTGFDGPFAGYSSANPNELFLPLTSYSADFSDTTPMGALSFKLTEDVNLYARVAKGFKSGGFSSEVALPSVTTPYKPQSSVMTELGMKANLLDNRARLNLAIFNTDITDLQTTQLLPGTTQSLLVNAGEATFRGVEVEAALLIADGWQVQLGYGYLDAEYDKYIDNSFLPGRPLIDTASNRRPPYAPEHTANFLLDGRLLQTGWGELRAILDFTYTAETYLYAVNKTLSAPNAGGQYVAALNGIPSQSNLNARLLLANVPAGPGTMDISLWGRNVTDEGDMLQGIDFSMFRTATWREPRTYMLTAEYKW